MINRSALLVQRDVRGAEVKGRHQESESEDWPQDLVDFGSPTLL